MTNEVPTRWERHKRWWRFQGVILMAVILYSAAMIYLTIRFPELGGR